MKNLLYSSTFPTMHTHNFGLAASETAMYRVIQLKYSTGYNLDSLWRKRTGTQTTVILSAISKMVSGLRAGYSKFVFFK